MDLHQALEQLETEQSQLEAMHATVKTSLLRLMVEEKKLKQMAAGAAPTSTPMSLTAPPAGAIQRFGRTVQQQPCSSTNHTAVVAPLASALAAARQRTEVPVVVGENTAGGSAPAEVQPMSEDESEGSEEESESDDDDEMDGEDGSSLRMQRILQARLGDNYNADDAGDYSSSAEDEDDTNDTSSALRTFLAARGH